MYFLIIKFLYLKEKKRIRLKKKIIIFKSIFKKIPPLFLLSFFYSILFQSCFCLKFQN